RQNAGPARLRGARSTREQLLERQLARAAHLGDDLHQPVPLTGCSPRLHLHADTLQGCNEAAIVDRLEKVVDRMRLEGADRVLVVRCYEHYDGQRLLRKMRQYVESGHAGHLDVQKQYI